MVILLLARLSRHALGFLVKGSRMMRSDSLGYGSDGAWIPGQRKHAEAANSPVAPTLPMKFQTKPRGQFSGCQASPVRR